MKCPNEIVCDVIVLVVWAPARTVTQVPRFVSAARTEFPNYSRRFHSVWCQRLQFKDPPVSLCACVVCAVSSGSRRLSPVICCVQHVRQLFLRVPDAAAHLLPALLCLLLPWRPKLPRGELCISINNSLEQNLLVYRIRMH